MFRQNHHLEKERIRKLYPIDIPQTGFTDSSIYGDDGSLQLGIEWPDPRFTDNDDGTVTDNLTNLVWLKDANCFGAVIWNNAIESSNELGDGYCGLNDGSFPGDWRLPNKNELSSIVDMSNYGNLLALPDGHPFINVIEAYYWSSTTAAFNQPAEAWYLRTYNGSMLYHAKSNFNYVWPVRDGD